jgi:hypothetical protein
MPAPETNTSQAMDELVIANPKIVLTPLGMEVAGTLTHEEWREIGRRLGRAMRSAAFVIGDWLVYGEGRAAQGTLWSEIPAQDVIPKQVYDEAVEVTGMDVATLINYAYVSKSIPRSLRNDQLSWEHHRKVAKIKDAQEKTRWLRIAAEQRENGKPVSTRRLSRSIQAGRLLSIEEMQDDDADRGIENVHPYVNSISAFWGKLLRGKWLDSATPEKRAALKRDLQPVIDIYHQL